jgi:hypothetical protein
MSWLLPPGFSIPLTEADKRRRTGERRGGQRLPQPTNIVTLVPFETKQKLS